MDGEQHSSAGRMEGGGYYTEHSEAQKAYGELGFEWLEQAAAEIDPPPKPQPFVIADMGAAGGGNSLEPMARALAARPAPHSAAALVVHTDIPSNDFSALFELVTKSPHSYLAPGVFPLAEGRSFYERLLPDGFLSLGWSSIAVHWLSAIPRPIPDHIYCSFARGPVREALRGQSARDWRAFLGHRARELRPSGRLVVIGGASRDDGASDAEGLMDAANSALVAMVDSGDIERDEYKRMTIPTWNRTSAEFVEPFESGELEGELELRRHDARWLPDHYYEAYEQDGDLERYARSASGFFRAAFEESLLAGLDPDRDNEQRRMIGKHFDALLRERIAAAPEDAACRWHVVVLDIARA